MAKLTKKEKDALQGVRDYIDNLDNNDEFQSALDKIIENRDNASEKTRQSEKDEIYGEMGTAAGILKDSLLPDVVDKLDTLISYMDE